MKNQIRKKLLVFGFSSLVLILALWLFLSVDQVPGHRELKAYLGDRLTTVEPLYDRSPLDSARSNTGLYILGGSQTSLEERFKIASQLYHQGLSERILFLSRPGITEYDPDRMRNLTNDEWSVMQLMRLGVKPEDIEPVVFKKGLFGTFTEARGLPEIAAQRNFKRMILVTSRFHTKRTWIAFSRTFGGRSIPLAIYAANDPADLDDLLLEYLKLALYNNVILPNYAGTGTPSIPAAVKVAAPR